MEGKEKPVSMTAEEKDKLSELLDKLAKEKCDVERGISSTCCTDYLFYIDGAYGGACAIGIVDDAIS